MELIGVPFDLAGKTSGSRLGPSAIRLAGITETLAKLGIALKDGADIPVLPPELPEAVPATRNPKTKSVPNPIPADSGLRNFHAAFDCVRTLKARVVHTLES